MEELRFDVSAIGNIQNGSRQLRGRFSGIEGQLSTTQNPANPSIPGPDDAVFALKVAALADYVVRQIVEHTLAVTAQATLEKAAASAMRRASSIPAGNRGQTPMS